MKFSIITPSIDRESLKKCCDSIDVQSHRNFEHLVAFDGFPNPRVYHSDAKRRYFRFRQTNKWGNYQRHAAWKYATGDVILYCDDDNFFTHPDALRDIALRIEMKPSYNWYLFPIMRHGSKFLMDPPGMCRTDTANVAIRREFAQWPDTDAREADGMLAEKLLAAHAYMAFPDCTPIITMEISSNGV